MSMNKQLVEEIQNIDAMLFGTSSVYANGDNIMLIHEMHGENVLNIYNSEGELIYNINYTKITRFSNFILIGCKYSVYIVDYNCTSVFKADKRINSDVCTLQSQNYRLIYFSNNILTLHTADNIEYTALLIDETNGKVVKQYNHVKDMINDARYFIKMSITYIDSDNKIQTDLVSSYGLVEKSELEKLFGFKVLGRNSEDSKLLDIKMDNKIGTISEDYSIINIKGRGKKMYEYQLDMSSLMQFRQAMISKQYDKAIIA